MNQFKGKKWTTMAIVMAFLFMFAIGPPMALAQDDDGWNDDWSNHWDMYPEKGSKYIITTDLSKQTPEQLVQQING
ncbi:MAG: hypothetical protein PHC60_09510 [Heliobacteriaceae bacterium]|nr:hypothetical protein [Heliobacteriaceae bacterium]MDD4588609.1 hypothetical protein [Heliobacteriaceae bacterium]